MKNPSPTESVQSAKATPLLRISDFINIESVVQDPSNQIASTFRLMPLSAAWAFSQEDFGWEKGEDDRQVCALLPFGRCGLTFNLDDRAAGVLRVVVDVSIEREVLLHSLEIPMGTVFDRPDTVWVPHLRPGADLVIADQIFRSPGVLIGRQGRCAALVPDLAAWPQGMRTWLDYQRYGPGGLPRLGFGLGHFRPTGHIFFKRIKNPLRLPRGSKIRTAFYLIRVPEDATEPRSWLASFLWNRFAPIDSMDPQVLSFEHYQAHACRRIVAPDLYHEFEYQGKTVGGMITQTFTARRRPPVLNHRGVRQYIRRQGLFVDVLRWIQAKMFTHPAGYRLLTRGLHTGLLQVAPMISFQSWFNQVRTALGVALHARRTGDEALFAKTGKMVELALAAPEESGCFPAVCFFTEKDVFWIRGTRAFELIDSFHLPDAAVTGFHLLQWHQYVKPDERIMARCDALARFFLSLQDSDGAFPTWAKPGPNGPIADDNLRQCASAAAPAMLLARQHRIRPDDRLLDSAQKALAFIEKQVLPEDRWFDYELFYSCAGRPTGEEGPDPYTGCYPANTLSMYWAAQAALDLFFATGNEKTLLTARTILARLSLHQQVFDHPHLSIHTFGGFGVMNADAEFNDARQGLFVPLYMDFYRATGDPEMLERAVAALRSCFTTMLVEEHRTIAPGNLVNFRPSDRGAILENYAHTGRDEVTAGYLSPDWGCGTALYASGLAFRELGQVYVDAERKKAFGVDLCRVLAATFNPDRVHLTVDSPRLTELEIVLDGAAENYPNMVVNGRPASMISEKPRRYRVSLPGRKE